MESEALTWTRHWRRGLRVAAGIVLLGATIVMLRGRLVNVWSTNPDIFYYPVFGLGVSLITSGFVRDKIDREIRRRYDEFNVRTTLAVLGRNVEAARQRLIEYSFLRAAEFDFHLGMSLLLVIENDLEKAYTNINSLHAAIMQTVSLGEQSKVEPAEGGSRRLDDLQSIMRDVSEATNRRNEIASGLLILKLGADDNISALLDSFNVVSSDLFKANIIMTEVISEHLQDMTDHDISRVRDYLVACASRTRHFLARLGIPVPNNLAEGDIEIFASVMGKTLEKGGDGLPAKTLKTGILVGVMLTDISSALKKINHYSPPRQPDSR